MKKAIFLIVLFFSAVLYSQSYQPYMTVLGFPEAWNITEGDENVIIAVLGNGIHTNHPALVNSISSIPGWNFYANNSNVTETRTLADYSHETQVAGIIAAQQTVYNNYIVRGLAPDCKIMPVKFYEPDDQNDPQKAQKLILSINFVRDKQLQYPEKRFMINLSFTFNGFNQTEKDLVANAIQNCYDDGIPVICGAGNGNGAVEFPANLTTTFAITCVSGTWFNYVYQNNYPTGEELDVAAPSHIEYTTYSNSGYWSFGQSSGVTPQVCAIAALVLSLDINLPVEELRRILHENTFTVIYDGDTNVLIDYDEYGYNQKVGYGRVDALASLSKHSIVFINNVEGNTSIGQMTVEGEILNSGDDYLFFRGEEVDPTAYEGTYSYNNFVNKFYNWNYWDYDDPNASARDRVNHFFSDKFFDDETENTTAFFKKTKPLTVRNYLEGGNGGTILFGEKDYDVINRNSPYNENAFLYNPPIVQSMYRAEANPTHNLFNTTWNFWRWENGSTNRIREEQISQSSPSEWRAIYKGNLTSNSTDGISSNSQRKIVRTDNGKYHVVYESLGHVWYTYSLTNDYYGQWRQDRCLSDDVGTLAKNPSIDYDGNIIKIVFEGYYPETAFIYLVTYAPDANGNYNQSGSGEEILNYSSSYFGSARPVITYNTYGDDGEVFVAYRRSSTGPIKQMTQWGKNGSWSSWSSETDIPNTNGDCVNPSVTGFSSNIQIAYENFGSIYFTGANRQEEQGNYSWDYFRDPINISAGSGFNLNRYPVISLSRSPAAYVMVSWQGIYNGQQQSPLPKEQGGSESLYRQAAVVKVGWSTSWYGTTNNFGSNVDFTNNGSLNTA
jgi:hypothetical protein